MSDATPDLLKNAVSLSQSPTVPPSSQLQTIEVSIQIALLFSDVEFYSCLKFFSCSGDNGAC